MSLDVSAALKDLLSAEVDKVNEDIDRSLANSLVQDESRKLYKWLRGKSAEAKAIRANIQESLLKGIKKQVPKAVEKAVKDTYIEFGGRYGGQYGY